VPPVFGKERDLSKGASSSPEGGLFRSPELPKIITISGANKDIGKSSLAAYLAGRCRSCAGMKVSMHEESLPGQAILEESDPRPDSQTDTARLLRAGAHPVFWIRTTREKLRDDLRTAFSSVQSPLVIMEGNSILEHLEPDYAVFIMGPTFDDFKPSAYGAIKKAHTVVVNGDVELTGAEMLHLEKGIKEINPDAKVVVVTELGRARAWEIVLSRAVGRLGGAYMSSEVEERVTETVKGAAKEGRLPCAVALKLAEEMGITPLEVGKAANALGLKIVKCSLGCF
jgi:hypothetical protein